MQRVMVRYKLKPDRVAENEELVRAVYEELESAERSDVRYATFKLEDGVTFVHLVSIETEDGRSPLGELNAFREFQKDIKDRTEEAPVATELDEIGTYRLFGS
jgi:L-rhamnose mutarotase